jgi:lantibiotic modifying enzyme
MKPEKTTDPDREELLAAAAEIAGQIRERHRRTPGGSVAWTGPTGYGSELIPLRILQLGPHLYHGTIGIALFLAAQARVAGDDEARELSLEAMAPLRRKLAEFAAAPERINGLQMHVGGLIGLGSFLYGLLTAGQLLEDEELVREAHHATVLFTPPQIARDCQFRVQTGCAGAILALLALHTRLPEPNTSGKTPIDIALECAGHLLAQRVSFEGRPRAWALSPGKIPLAGFSYGAAGVSYALLRLYEVTRMPELAAAAREGLAFVRGLYSPERGGWRDIRADFESRYRPRRGTWRDWWAQGTLDDLEKSDSASPADDRYPDMWCHGSAGIALGRLGALHLEDGPEVRDEIDCTLKNARAYARIRAFADSGPDDLCCGHIGRIELLLYAYRRLGGGESLESAKALMARVLDRAQTEGRFQLSAARGTESFAPSLFQGIAGIGYTLLRLAEPEALPCLLLLE